MGLWTAKNLCFVPNLLFCAWLGIRKGKFHFFWGVLALGPAINNPIHGGRFWPKNGPPPLFWGFFGVLKCVWKSDNLRLFFETLLVENMGKMVEIVDFLYKYMEKCSKIHEIWGLFDQNWGKMEGFGPIWDFGMQKTCVFCQNC